MGNINWAEFDKKFILNNLKSKEYWLDYANLFDKKFENDKEEIKNRLYNIDNNIKDPEVRSELMAELQSDELDISLDRDMIFSALIVILYSRFEITVKIMLKSLPNEQIEIIENKNKINRFMFEEIKESLGKLGITIEDKYFNNIKHTRIISNNFKHEPYSYALVKYDEREVNCLKENKKKLTVHIAKHYKYCYDFLNILYDELFKKYELHLYYGQDKFQS